MASPRPSPLNRKQRRELTRRLRAADPGLDVIHPNAAGLDVGNSAHYVAVRPDRDPDPVRRVDCFTADLHRLADWLQHCGVTTVALQSTGVYWLPLYDILDARGLEVQAREAFRSEAFTADGTSIATKRSAENK
jgi:hypothetical protein